MLALVPAAFFAIEISGSYSTFQKWSAEGPIAVQGRYIYGGIAAVAALTALGWHKLIRPRLYPSLALVVGVGAAVTNFTVWLLILRSWYAPSGDHGLLSASRAGFHSLLRWSPVPDAITILLVVVAPIVTGALTVVVLAGDRFREQSRIASGRGAEDDQPAPAPGSNTSPMAKSTTAPSG